MPLWVNAHHGARHLMFYCTQMQGSVYLSDPFWWGTVANFLQLSVFQVAGCHAAPAGFSPSLSWQQQQVCNFSDVRQVKQHAHEQLPKSFTTFVSHVQYKWKSKKAMPLKSLVKNLKLLGSVFACYFCYCFLMQTLEKVHYIMFSDFCFQSIAKNRNHWSSHTLDDNVQMVRRWHGSFNSSKIVNWSPPHRRFLSLSWKMCWRETNWIRDFAFVLNLHFFTCVFFYSQS